MEVNTDPFSVIMYRAELAALLAFASKDETRPHISAVVLRRDGAFATDGVGLVAGHFKEPLGGFVPVVMPRYPLKRLLAAVPKSGGIRISPAIGQADPSIMSVCVEVVHGLYLASRFDGSKPVLTATIQALNVSPPPYEQVMAQKLREGDAPPRFKPKLLDRLRLVDAAADAAGFSGASGVEIEFGAGEGSKREPTRVRWVDYHQPWTVIVMPLSV